MMTWMLDWMIALPGLSRRKGPWHPVTNRIDDRLPAMSQIVGVELGDVRRAYSLDYLREQQVVNDEIGDQPIVIFYDAKMIRGPSFPSGQWPGPLLPTNIRGRGRGNVRRDALDVRGVELSPHGDNAARHLDPVPHFGKAFWFSWSMFKNGTEVIAS